MSRVYVSLWYSSTAMGVRRVQRLCEHVRLKRAITQRAVSRHSLSPVPAPPVTCPVGLNTLPASLVPWHNIITSSEWGECAGGAGWDSDFVERKMSGLISQLQPVSLGHLSERSSIRQMKLRLSLF